MKTLICCFCSFLIFIFIFSNSIFAQGTYQFRLYAGAVFPQGDFGSTSTEKAGFANTGFCIMLEGEAISYVNVTWVSSVSFAVNSLDESSMRDQISQELSQVLGSPVSITLDVDSYITTWIMTGIRVQKFITPSVTLYGSGQIGLLLSRFPDIKVYLMDVPITQTTTMGKAFAYGFSAGTCINDKVSIGIAYYSSEPEYEQTASSMGTTLADVRVKLPASVLQLMVGISL